MIHSVEEVDHGALLLDGPSRAGHRLCGSGAVSTRGSPACWGEWELRDQAGQAPGAKRLTGAYAPGATTWYGQAGPVQEFLFGEVEKKPDITMPELAARLMTEHGITAAPAALSRLLCRNGFTYKKSPDGGGMRTRRHSG